MLDIQIVHPTLPVIMLGDFNIVLEDRDSINRNTNGRGSASKDQAQMSPKTSPHF